MEDKDSDNQSGADWPKMGVTVAAIASESTVALKRIKSPRDERSLFVMKFLILTLYETANKKNHRQLPNGGLAISVVGI